MAMNFFEYQEAAHKKTHLLVIYFIAAVLLIVVIVNIAVGLILMGAGTWRGAHAVYQPMSGGQEFFGVPVEELQVFGAVTAGTLLVIGLGTIYRMGSLAGGGSAVAEMMGAVPVASDTQDVDQRKLLNVVQEMSIASGVPMPAVYYMPNERGINAFAAGFSQSDAAITVTRGCMQHLTRDELQGVIGHEFSHILNGDTRLNVRLIGMLYGIMVLSLTGYWAMRIMENSHPGYTDRDDRRGGGAGVAIAIFLAGLAVWAIGSIGMFFAKLIQAAVSRQREFLADASSVQFTRNPDGLAGALKKIGGSGMGSVIDDPHGQEVAHMFFASGVLTMTDALATHPPIEQRILRIDPNWDGKFTPVKNGDEADIEKELEKPRYIERPIGGVPMQLVANDVLRKVGTTSPEHLVYAEATLEQIPPNLRSAASDPFSARAIVFALTIASDNAPLPMVSAMISQQLDPTIAKITQQVASAVAQLGPAGRMPLLNLCLPALRTLTAAQAQQFFAVLQQIIEADGIVNIHEYAIAKIVRKAIEPSPATSPQYFAVKPLLNQAAIMLSALARTNPDPQAANQAFFFGWNRLGEGATPAMQSVSAMQLDAALDEINKSAPPVKRRFIDAAAHCIACDGVIEVEEAELMRAIAATLDCPLPPLVLGSGVAIGSSM